MAERKRGRRSPLLAGRPSNVWHADIAPLIRGYPKTQEAFDKLQARCRAQVLLVNAAGKGTRRGVPDGFAHRKGDLEEARSAARVVARRTVKYMKEHDMIAPSSKASDADRAEIALEAAVEIVVATDNAGVYVNSSRDRQAALKTILEFTKAKPAATQNVNLSTAEAFLASLA
jgi:hypothetical protein